MRVKRNWRKSRFIFVLVCFNVKRFPTFSFYATTILQRSVLDRPTNLVDNENILLLYYDFCALTRDVKKQFFFTMFIFFFRT